MELIQISDTYKETGDSFLESSKLVSVLEKYGRIEFEGAYAGNVMLHGDVDVKVIKDNDFTQEELFIAFKDIHDTCGDNFRSLFIKADWDDPRLGQQFPNGRYIGLKTYVNDERWKFDIWFISEDENNRDRGKLDISKADVAHEQRLKILEFKQYRKEHNIKVSGQEIYEAVIENDIADPELFFKNI
jgi:hypothetical protein